MISTRKILKLFKHFYKVDTNTDLCWGEDSTYFGPRAGPGHVLLQAGLARKEGVLAPAKTAGGGGGCEWRGRGQILEKVQGENGDGKIINGKREET